MTDPHKPLRVSIIGAGPGGLTLARILQETTSVSELQLTVYEREESRNARSQGGSLDLHDDTGLRALRAAGLIEEFKKYARPEGEEVRIYDKSGYLRFHMESPPPDSKKVDDDVSGRPEIDREDLRNILLDSINPQSIRWGHQLVSLQPAPSTTTNEYELTFSSGEKVITDLVVGADGAWSRIRPLLNPSAVPQYSGFSCIDLRITSADERFPKLSEMAGNGMCFFLGDEKSFSIQRNSHGKLKVGGNLKQKDENWVDQFKGLEIDVLKERLIEQFEGYGDVVMDFIRAADDDHVLLRKVHAIPLSCYSFPPHPSLTMLGDAAHLMSSFGGDGVNLAMADATDLASQLSYFLSSRSKPNSRIALVDVLGTYSKGMFKRALPAGRSAARNIKFCHDPDAVEIISRALRILIKFSFSALFSVVPWFTVWAFRRSSAWLFQSLWFSRSSSP